MRIGHMGLIFSFENVVTSANTDLCQIKIFYNFRSCVYELWLIHANFTSFHLFQLFHLFHLIFHLFHSNQI